MGSWERVVRATASRSRGVDFYKSGAAFPPRSRVGLGALVGNPIPMLPVLRPCEPTASPCELHSDRGFRVPRPSGAPAWPLRPPAARRRFSRFVLGTQRRSRPPCLGSRTGESEVPDRYVPGAQQKLNAWRQRRRLRTRLPRQRAPGRPSGSGQRAAAESVSVNAGDEGGRERGNIQRAPQPHGHRSSRQASTSPALLARSWSLSEGRYLGRVRGRLSAEGS